MAAVIATACLVAGPLASAARADDVAAAPIGGSDLGSPPPITPDPGSDPGSSPSVQVPANTDPAAGEQAGTDQQSSSPPVDSSAGTDGGAAADAPADDGATDGGSPRDDGAAQVPSSDSQHESAATASPATDAGDGAAGAPPTSPPTSNAAPPPAASGAPITAPLTPGGAGSGMALLDIDTGGMGLRLPHSVRCDFCYRGVRFAAWLAGATSESQLQHRSTAQTGGAKASALSLIAFAWAPDPLTAQLFRLLGGGGGTVAVLLFSFLAVVAGIVLAAPEGTRAFRISTVTWRPSPYVRPLELPG